MSGRDTDFILEITVNNNTPTPSQVPKLPGGWRNIGCGESECINYNMHYIFYGPKDSYNKVKNLLESWATKNKLEHRFEQTK